MRSKNIKARLILENGEIFDGKAFGYIKEAVGEVVFTTGITGYQEVLTDPSYAGQIVCMTYPLIGNYGINLEDMESDKPHLAGFIVREKCEFPNNWRAEMDLADFLKQSKIMGIEGIDTRALTRIIRKGGAMKGIITTRFDSLLQNQIAQKFSTSSNKNITEEITCKEKHIIEGKGLHIAVIDLGVKNSILKNLSHRNCKLTVFPAFTTAEEILESNPDGILISNGAGNPDNILEITQTVKILLETKPVVGIALGSLVLAKALGCSVEPLKFGHHGNSPVKNIETGKIYTTNQNHGYVVSQCPENIKIQWTNINDGTIEGFCHKSLPAQGVCFYPESDTEHADSEFIYSRLIKTIQEGRAKNA